MNRFQALLLVCLVWAAIYLPGLGSTELKGEEGRRILPAMTMLETGNFVLPYVGGKPYLRKPPLVNWVIAVFFKVSGVTNEWVARMPTVLFVLALAVTFVALAGRAGWLSIEAGLVAALLFLTQVATVEKGRMAELEGIYFSLSGLAIVGWLAWWAQGRSPWLWWIVPHLFLGLGLLAKGGAHLLFFYAIVVAVLWHAKELRRLWHPAHFVGLLLMAGIFYAWKVPYMKYPDPARYAEAVWWQQSVGRLNGPFHFGDWAMTIPRALGDHLPWILFAPLLWRRDFLPLGQRELALFRGTRLAMVLTFFGLLLLPGMLPRYTLPLLAPFSMLLAYALADERILPAAGSLRAWWRSNTGLAALVILAALSGPALHAWSRRMALADPTKFPNGFVTNFEFVLLAAGGAIFVGFFVLVGRYKLARPSLLAGASAALAGAGLLLYAAVGIPLLNSHDKLRPAARKIDAAIPPDEGLVVYDPDYQPVLFYLQTPFIYAGIQEEIPPDARWMLAREESRPRLEEGQPQFKEVAEIPKPFSLLILHDPAPVPLPPPPSLSDFVDSANLPDLTKTAVPWWKKPAGQRGEPKREPKQ